VDIGDYAVFDNMGAYTVVFKPPFIRPNPSIVTYDSETGSYCLSRRAETFDDVFASYSI
jgi:diaminopimelate decarboxylase